MKKSIKQKKHNLKSINIITKIALFIVVLTGVFFMKSSYASANVSGLCFPGTVSNPGYIVRLNNATDEQVTSTCTSQGATVITEGSPVPFGICVHPPNPPPMYTALSETPNCEDSGGTRIAAGGTLPVTSGTTTDPTPPGEAVDPIEKAKFEACKDADSCDITAKFIDPAIKVLTGAVGLIVTIMIVVAGIQYSSAGSDPQKVAAAKSKVTNAIIALVTYIFLFGLLQWLWPGGLV